MVRLENRAAPRRSRAPGHPRSSPCGPTYCGVPEKNFGILLGRQKTSLGIIFFFFLVFSSNSGSPKRTPVFFFSYGLKISKSSFLFFLWAEAETKIFVYLEASLGQAFSTKFGLQNGTHGFLFFFLVWGWKKNDTDM